MQPDSTILKVCTKCGALKPLDLFYRCCGYPDGRSRTCIECERAYKRRPDVMAKARVTATQSHGRKLARRRHLPATLTQRQWDDAIAYFGGCAYCGSAEGTLHRDHFIPEWRGGAFTADNIVPACASCNYRKHQRLPEDWCEPETYARVLTYFTSLSLTPNGDRPLREPKGYATGDRHGSRTHPEKLSRGVSRWSAKLCEADVRSIRERYDAKLATQQVLAVEFGVTQTLISQVVRRVIWRHIP